MVLEMGFEPTPPGRGDGREGINGIFLLEPELAAWWLSPLACKGDGQGCLSAPTDFL